MKLLADIEGTSGKTAWQSYSITHGIEKLEILVPLKQVPAFESVLKQPIASKKDLIEQIISLGGEVV